MNRKAINIQKVIDRIKNPYPPDDLISTYKDFLRFREFIPFYQFNPKVFHAILKVTNDTWHSKKRISRLSLIDTLRKYLQTKKDRELELESRLLIFEVFKKSIMEPEPVYIRHLSDIRAFLNSMLKDQPLTEGEKQWLCDHADESEHILNRLLRYPVKSKVIHDWAAKNYETDRYRLRRAEIVGWIISEKPDFEVARQTLIDDFEYANKLDRDQLKKFDDEAESMRFATASKHAFFPTSDEELYSDVLSNDSDLEVLAIDVKFLRRPYHVPMIPGRPNYTLFKDMKESDYSPYTFTIPDFEQLEKEFHENLDIIFRSAMTWAIFYSKLNKRQKVSRLKKYYHDDIFRSFMKVCERLEATELLEWMKGKAK